MLSSQKQNNKNDSIEKTAVKKASDHSNVDMSALQFTGIMSTDEVLKLYCYDSWIIKYI